MFYYYYCHYYNYYHWMPYSPAKLRSKTEASADDVKCCRPLGYYGSPL